MSDLSLFSIALELAKLEKTSTTGNRRNEEIINIFTEYAEKIYKTYRKCTDANKSDSD